jgi:hypothetical protein
MHYDMETTDLSQTELGLANTGLVHLFPNSEQALSQVHSRC